MGVEQFVRPVGLMAPRSVVRIYPPLQFLCAVFMGGGGAFVIVVSREWFLDRCVLRRCLLGF